MDRRILISLALFSIAGMIPAHAQMPDMPNMGGMGGMPDLSSMSIGNAAGVLEYCMKNKLLGGTDATSVLGGLTKQPDVKQSDDYKLGTAGTIQSAGKSPLSLDSVPPKMKTKACDMVLKHAKSLI